MEQINNIEQYNNDNFSNYVTAKDKDEIIQIDDEYDEYEIFDDKDSQEKYDVFLKKKIYNYNDENNKKNQKKLAEPFKMLYKAFAYSLFSNNLSIDAKFGIICPIVSTSYIIYDTRDLNYSYIIGSVFRNEHREIILAKLILEVEKPHRITQACNYFASQGPVSVLKACNKDIIYENVCTIMSIFVDILGLYSSVSISTILKEKTTFYDIFSNKFKEYKIKNDKFYWKYNKNNDFDNENKKNRNHCIEKNIDIKSISTLEENNFKIYKANNCRMFIDNYDLYIMPLKIRTILLLKSRFIKYIGAEKQIKDSLLLYHKLIRSQIDFDKLSNALLINKEILTPQIFYESLMQYKPYEFFVMKEPLQVYEKETLIRMRILKEKPISDYLPKRINWVIKFVPVFALLVAFGFSLASLIISLKKK